MSVLRGPGKRFAKARSGSYQTDSDYPRPEPIDPRVDPGPETTDLDPEHQHPEFLHPEPVEEIQGKACGKKRLKHLEAC